MVQEDVGSALLQIRFMVTPPNFEWCQLVTVADIQNNRRGTQTRGHPAPKMERIIGVGCFSRPVPLIDF
jgi:hypothetical protein